MKWFTYAALIMILFSLDSYAQEKPNDSLKTVPPPVISRTYEDFSMPDFELYRNLYFENDLPAADSNSIWLWTSYVLSSHNSGHYLPSGAEPHMLANYHQKYIEESKFSVVKTVLAMAQLSAVGYLAYRSIKEHGFWDNK